MKLAFLASAVAACIQGFYNAILYISFCQGAAREQQQLLAFVSFSRMELAVVCGEGGEVSA